MKEEFKENQSYLDELNQKWEWEQEQWRNEQRRFEREHGGTDGEEEVLKTADNTGEYGAQFVSQKRNMLDYSPLQTQLEQDMTYEPEGNSLSRKTNFPVGTFVKNGAATFFKSVLVINKIRRFLLLGIGAAVLLSMMYFQNSTSESLKVEEEPKYDITSDTRPILGETSAKEGNQKIHYALREVKEKSYIKSGVNILMEGYVYIISITNSASENTFGASFHGMKGETAEQDIIESVELYQSDQSFYEKNKCHSERTRIAPGTTKNICFIFQLPIKNILVKDETDGTLITTSLKRFKVGEEKASSTKEHLKHGAAYQGYGSNREVQIESFVQNDKKSERYTLLEMRAEVKESGSEINDGIKEVFIETEDGVFYGETYLNVSDETRMTRKEYLEKIKTGAKRGEHFEYYLSFPKIKSKIKNIYFVEELLINGHYTSVTTILDY